MKLHTVKFRIYLRYMKGCIEKWNIPENFVKLRKCFHILMQVYKLLSNAILDMLTSQNFTGLSILTSKIDPEQLRSAAPEMNISSVPDIVSGSQHFVPVTRNSCRSTVYGILLNFENLPVIVTDRKRILSVTHEIVPDNDRWPVVISCTRSIS